MQGLQDMQKVQFEAETLWHTDLGIQTLSQLLNLRLECCVLCLKLADGASRIILSGTGC